MQAWVGPRLTMLTTSDEKSPSMAASELIDGSCAGGEKRRSGGVNCQYVPLL